MRSTASAQSARNDLRSGTLASRARGFCLFILFSGDRACQAQPDSQSTESPAHHPGILPQDALLCEHGMVSSLMQNYCGARLLRCAVLGILMYWRVHSGSCAPRASHPGSS